MRKNPTKLLIKKVEKILWQDWDPIGLNTFEDTGPVDEYNSYAPNIAKLLLQRVDAHKIAHRLSQIAEVSMGLNKNSEHSAHVAELLLSLVEE
jgi:hypothetical protein